MPDVDDAFARATDDLIALYRNIERRAIDVPFISFMPLLIVFWSILKFEFFWVVGVFLIIPVNLVILIRNIFPGRWRYRPFFLRQLYYAWLWIWRGEVPTTPFIFIRPLFRVFMIGHFERRLRRLRLEILLQEGMSETARSALLPRIDAALERWKTRPFPKLFFTALLPVLVAFPSWLKQCMDSLGAIGLQMPVGMAANLTPNMSPRTILFLGLSALGYVLVIPITSFLAKRGLFIGVETNRICFPGGQAGSGAYLKEREILGKVGLHPREAPTDLWLAGISIVFSFVFVLFFLDYYFSMITEIIAASPEFATLPPETQRQFESGQLKSSMTSGGLFMMVFLGSVAVAAFRRRSTGRA